MNKELNKIRVAGNEAGARFDHYFNTFLLEFYTFAYSTFCEAHCVVTIVGSKKQKQDEPRESKRIMMSMSIRCKTNKITLKILSKHS